MYLHLTTFTDFKTDAGSCIPTENSSETLQAIDKTYKTSQSDGGLLEWTFRFDAIDTGTGDDGRWEREDART